MAQQQQPDDRQKKRDANVETMRGMLEKMKGEIGKILVKSLPVERFIRVALTTVRRSYQLQEATPGSVLGAMMLAAQDGLEIDGVQACMVAYWNSDMRCYEAQYQQMYRGQMALARRGGQVIAIEPECVYEGDDFYEEKGLNPKLKHIPHYKTRNVTHVYTIATLKGGQRMFRTMPVAEINSQHRDRSKSWTSKKGPSGPWVDDYDSMAMKSGIRTHIKYLPTPADAQASVQADFDREQGRLPATVAIGELMPAQYFDTVPDNLSHADQREPVAAAAQARPAESAPPAAAAPPPGPAAAQSPAAKGATKSPGALFKEVKAWFAEQHDENPRLAATALFRQVAEHGSPGEYTPEEVEKVQAKLEQLKAAASNAPRAAAPHEVVDGKFIGDPPKDAPAAGAQDGRGADSAVHPTQPASGVRPALAAAPAEQEKKADGTGDLFSDEPDEHSAVPAPALPDFVPLVDMEPILAILHQWCGETGVTTPKNQDAVIDAYFKEMGFEDLAHVPLAFVAKMKRASDTESVFKTIVKVLLADAPKGKAKR
jgi:recombination protein RecT